jgi:N-acyl-D-amino-acid deacylase
VRETIRIGEEAGVPVSVTHFKACGRDNWGLMRKAVSAIEEARARGIRITADQYPFDQSAPIGFITELVDVPRDMEPFAEIRRARRGASPEERARLRDEYVQSLQSALRDESTRARLRESTYEPRVSDPSPAARWGWQDFRIKVAVTNARLLDRNLGELAEEQGRDGFEIVADLVLSEPDMLFASGSQSGDDLRLAMTRPWVMVSSDGGAFAPVPHDAPPVRAHPRSFASQAVLLRKFVREEGLLSLEEAIRKMTSLPASLLGLERRGLLREGYAADVVVFDPDSISDRATYADARKYAVGVRYVLVNGEVSVAEGTFNGHVSGKVLLKKDES